LYPDIQHHAVKKWSEEQILHFSYPGIQHQGRGGVRSRFFISCILVFYTREEVECGTDSSTLVPWYSTPGKRWSEEQILHLLYPGIPHQGKGGVRSRFCTYCILVFHTREEVE
jgi:hypothetical protein